MGLDINHYKLTLKPNEEGNYFTLEDWDLDCNVPLTAFAPFITKVKTWETLHSIAVVKNEEDYYKLLKSYEKDNEEHDYAKIFVGEKSDSLLDEIREFIKKNNWDKLERLDLEVTEGNFKHFDISFSDVAYVDGFYYEQVGYQRKGMNNKFYDTFREFLLWGKKEDFELALTCVGTEWYIENWGLEAVNDMKKNFKENFVDKYEFGKSLLCASF